MLGRGGSIKRENLITQQLDAYGQLHYVWKSAIAEMLLKCFDIRRFELTKLLGLVRGPPEFGSCYSQGHARASKIGVLESFILYSKNRRCSNARYRILIR